MQLSWFKRPKHVVDKPYPPSTPPARIRHRRRLGAPRSEFPIKSIVFFSFLSPSPLAAHCPLADLSVSVYICLYLSISVCSGAPCGPMTAESDSEVPEGSDFQVPEGSDFELKR